MRGTVLEYVCSMVQLGGTCKKGHPCYEGAGEPVAHAGIVHVACSS